MSAPEGAPTPNERRRAGELAEQLDGATWHTVGPPWGDRTWIVSGNGDPHVSRFVCDCNNDVDPETDEGERWVFGEADFIALTDPAFVLGLLDALDAAERERDRAVGLLGETSKEDFR